MMGLLKDIGTESCTHLLGLSVPKKLGIWVLPLMAIWLRGSVMFTETVPLSAPCLDLYLTPVSSVPSAVSVPLPFLGERMERMQWGFQEEVD